MGELPHGLIIEVGNLRHDYGFLVEMADLFGSDPTTLALRQPQEFPPGRFGLERLRESGWGRRGVGHEDGEHD
jgi:hypothetical protein